jgi:alkylation response protein AidB-like acyl-CoA dehydrogenase
MLDPGSRQLLEATAAACLAPPLDLAEPAALGWTGLLTPTDYGGEGWLPAEAALLALETGRQNAPSTWALSAAAAAAASDGGAPSQVKALLEGGLVGSLCVVPDVGWEQTSLRPGLRLEVLSDRSPDLIVALDPAGERAALLDVSELAVERVGDEALETVRPLYRAEVPGGGVALGARRASAVLAASRVLLAADSVGAIRAALAMVTEHLCEREAFGAPLASFQVLQHRLVDWTVFEQAAAALVDRAAEHLAEEPVSERLSRALHAYVESRAVQAVDDLIQLSGAMGFTWEYPLHHLLRRVATNAWLLGSGRSSRASLVPGFRASAG